MKRIIWLLPIIAILVGMATNFYFSSAASSFLHTAVESNYPHLAASQQLIFDLNGLQDSFKTAVSTGDKNGLQLSATKAAAFRADLATLAKIPGSAESARQIEREFNTYYSAAEQAAAMMLELRQGDIAESAAAMQKSQNVLGAQLLAAKNGGQKRLDTSILGSERYLSQGLIANILVAIMILLVSLGVARYSVVQVLRQLGGEPDYAKTIVHSVADGNLQVPVKLRPRDNASLLFGVKGMQDKFAAIILDIRHAVTSVRAATTEIASGNMDLSRRTEQQGASLEQTAATLDELTSTVQTNAANAHQAETLAGNAARIAGAGGQAVKRMVGTMEKINHSAKKIVDIIGVIDGIAFQTNILALNAAVEAARAGDQGRGFAVVAGEVRNLAQRSAKAAREIKELISDSVEKVAEGSAQAEAAGSTMDEIVGSVQHVSDLIGRIAAASSEQSNSINQVNKAVAELEAVTQENASLVENAAAASTSLDELAQRVSDALSAFHVEPASGHDTGITDFQIPSPPSRRQRNFSVLSIG